MKSIAIGPSELEVLEKTASLVRTLSSERDKLASELATYKKREQAGNIVSRMERKGLSDPTIPFQDRVASLLASDKDLDVVKEAAEMASSSVGLGELADGVGSDDELNSEQALLDYLLS